MAKHISKRRKIAPARSRTENAHRPAKQQKQTPQGRTQATRQTSQRPPIPFDEDDDILLVGEGDFSFAHCLLLHHADRFRTLTATTLETREDLLQKHPQSEDYIDALLAENEDGHDNGEAEGEQDAGDSGPEHRDIPQHHTKEPPRCVVHYTTNATSLSKVPHLRRRTFSKIVFNFPHVGGKSTDVNRQVRYNQEMIHAFLGECLVLLSGSRGKPKKRDRQSLGSQKAAWNDALATGEESNGRDLVAEHEAGNGEVREETRPQKKVRKHGAKLAEDLKEKSVLVTLFEGEPYTLWNIRDLARSVGLECRRSWKFEWSDWPGYRHARTLGNLKGKDDGDGQEEGGNEDGLGKERLGEKKKKDSKAGWKGEERSARTYEFGLKGDTLDAGVNMDKRKKGVGDNSSDED